MDDLRINAYDDVIKLITLVNAFEIMSFRCPI